jgi:ferritin-like metal-binding protein YciE
MKLNSFKNLLIEELRDIYDAEQQLVKALPRFAETAVLPDLKKAFVEHLEQTEKHIQRLDEFSRGSMSLPPGTDARR